MPKASESWNWSKYKSDNKCGLNQETPNQRDPTDG